MSENQSQTYAGRLSIRAVRDFEKRTPPGSYLITSEGKSISAPNGELVLMVEEMGWVDEKGEIKGPLENKI